jgi:crotonobetainyl-CoA:carnitine CoA-transferase CaiB-like acyl-CoA transferase
MERDEIDRLLQSAGLTWPEDVQITINGNSPVLTYRYRIDEAAAVAAAMTGAAASRLWQLRTGADGQSISVDVRAASAATAALAIDSLDGQNIQASSGNLCNYFECRDGDWIHLHGSLPHQHQGTLDLLGCSDDLDSIAAVVKRWNSFELEEELAARKLCAVRARTEDEWRAHPQGAFVTSVPAVEILKIDDAEPAPLPSGGDRPLGSMRVLEFARVLAAPVCGRTLAEHGADVLNVSAKKLPGLFHSEVTTGWGKRSCHLDLDVPEEHARMLELARSADVIVNGYRARHLQRRGLDPHELAAERPGLVYVSINCYGHDGPWVERGGWEQLAQAASGLALAQANGGAPSRLPSLYKGHKPRIIPAPNDIVTGYLAAYGAMNALARRATEGGSWWVRVSLCQTANWFLKSGRVPHPEQAPGFGDLSSYLESARSALGDHTHVAPVVRMSRTQPRWDRPPSPRGADAAEWVSETLAGV